MGIKGTGEIVTENKMGVEPMGRLLIKMSAPMALSMLVQALYNVVDSIFVSRINENALTAVTLAFTIQQLQIAFVIGTCVGMNARLSKKLGEKNYRDVNETAGNGLFLAIVYSLAFLVLGLLIAGKYYETMTADPQIRIYGKEYLSVIMCFAVGIVMQSFMEKLLQSTGMTLYSTICQLVGAVANLILDPIMIFGYFGCPAMGVRGAAIATVIGQCTAAALGLFFNIKYNKEISIRLKYLMPRGKVIREIYGVGIPSIVMQATSSVLTFFMNKILIGFTTTATAVYGVYFKLHSFVFFPIFGITGSTVPVIAYNFGARKPDRIKEAIKYAILYATIIMLTGLVIVQTMPEVLLGFFNASDTMIQIGVPALRTVSWAFLLAGPMVVCSSVYQALGHGMESLLVAITRQLVLQLPFAYILSRIGGLNALWYAIPLSEVLAFILNAAMYKRVMGMEVESLYEQTVPAQEQ